MQGHWCILSSNRLGFFFFFVPRADIGIYIYTKDKRRFDAFQWATGIERRMACRLWDNDDDARVTTLIATNVNNRKEFAAQKATSHHGALAEGGAI